jgi:hypothetical protein
MIYGNAQLDWGFRGTVRDLLRRCTKSFAVTGQAEELSSSIRPSHRVSANREQNIREYYNLIVNLHRCF